MRPGRFAPAGGTSFTSIVAPLPSAVVFQPSSGRGSAARAAAIGAPQRGSGAAILSTGNASSRSAPSGMHTSLQTSQSARARSTAGVPVATVCCGVELHEMQHLAVVPVVDQRTRRQRVRRRPFDRPRADSRGQLPLERRGQPRIAGVLPIRVPPFLHREAQRNRERFARDERRLRGDELGLDVLGFHRRGNRFAMQARPTPQR